MTVTAYCLKCRAKRTMERAVEGTTANGRRIMRGKCGVCDTKMNLFLGNGDGDAAKRPRSKKRSVAKKERRSASVSP